jgi:ClpP class serine protease
MTITDFIWILLLIPFFYPQIKARIRESRRLLLIRQIEKKRNSRVITLVHRQMGFPLLSLFLSRFIDIESSEQILKAIRETPKDKPIDLIIHTPGGLVLATQQIAQALANHPAKITVFVPHYAMSGGTFITLAADEVAMDPNAILGQIDPQVSNMPALSIIKVLKTKKPEDIKDKTIILADISDKALNQVKETARSLLEKSDYTSKEAKTITDKLTSLKYTHDHPITYQKAKEIGLKVSDKIDEDIYDLMDIYLAPERDSKSVEYIKREDR